MNSVVYFLYFNCPAVEHCWKNHTPYRCWHYKLWSPTPSGPLLLLGSLSLFPWSAYPPILQFFYYNDNRFSSVMTHWVPMVIRHRVLLSVMHGAISDFLCSPQVSGFIVCPSTEPQSQTPLSASIGNLSSHFMEKTGTI